MNILLATYNFYPYNWGGSEIYVSGLAKFLISNDHTVTVLADVPESAFTEHGTHFTSDFFKSVTYKYDNINIIGIKFFNNNIDEIYSKFNTKWIMAWESLFVQSNTLRFDILHLHAHTMVISRAMIIGMKNIYSTVKIIYSYHTPMTCVKDTLMFKDKLINCTVKPTSTICTACIITERTHIPIGLTKSITHLFPKFKKSQLPTSIKLKYLVGEHINSVQKLIPQVQKWLVFSNQILDNLIINGIPKEKIAMIRHGVAHNFISQQTTQRKLKPVIFAFIGRFKQFKGFITLLQAWCSLQENSLKELWLIGDKVENDRPLIAKIPDISGRNDVKWLGHKTQAEISAILKEVSCVIVPSEWVEIGPLVFHEAIASGCDVIASDIGGCKELAFYYQGKSHIFKAGDSNSLAKQISSFSFSNKLLTVRDQSVNYSDVLKQYLTIK